MWANNKKEVNQIMKKNTNSTSTIVNITGNNNTVIINGTASLGKETSKKKKSFKTWLKALGKLIRSAFVNISVLLIEIFAKLG
ncbi:MAG TPA: hypothetical protein DEV78_01120 [Clostridiales bacterium]|nr:hypothetical protein [Clostridiales bacterium]